MTAYGYADNVGIDGYAGAELSLVFGYGGTGLQNYVFAPVVSSTTAAQSFNVNGVYVAPVNQPFMVNLWVDAEGNAYLPPAFPPSEAVPNPVASASAYVDPYFSLSPDLTNEGYSIVTSNGIGNSPIAAPGPVPGAGLLSLGFFALPGAVAKAREVAGFAGRRDART